MATAVFEVGAALFGACVGSFLNVVVYRLPQEDPAKRSLGGRSHCPCCGKQIRWSDNIPVFGWMLLAGKARCCKQPIAIRYPAVELLTAVLFWALAAYPPVQSGGDLAREIGAFGFLATFTSLLVACTFIDLDHYILPDRLTKPGMVIGVVAGGWPGVAGAFSDDASVPPALRSLLASVIGLVVGAGVIWLVRAIGSWAFRREAMGLGDVKFLGMIGAFVGYEGALLTLLLACVAGAAIGGVALARRGVAARIPFGPYLALGAALALFWRGPILHFLFVTWPDMQRTSASAQWILLGVALLSLVLLFALVRRGRRR